jgi:hypothetical protein
MLCGYRRFRVHCEAEGCFMRVRIRGVQHDWQVRWCDITRGTAAQFRAIGNARVDGLASCNVRNGGTCYRKLNPGSPGQCSSGDRVSGLRPKAYPPQVHYAASPTQLVPLPPLPPFLISLRIFYTRHKNMAYILMLLGNDVGSRIVNLAIIVCLVSLHPLARNSPSSY